MKGNFCSVPSLNFLPVTLRVIAQRLTLEDPK